MSHAGVRSAAKVLSRGVPCGRYLTDFFPLSAGGSVRELGAQWIHGIENPLYVFSKAYELLADNLNEISYEDKGLFCTPAGAVDKMIIGEVQKVLNDTKNALVECEDGEKISADCVIISASVGFLKENMDTFFSPSLPEKKIKALSNIGFGTMDKIFLIFDEPFWTSDDHGFQIIWANEDEKSITLQNEVKIITLL
ncbi:peroxisomal N(1)-acetyl-spermine/spermidine oxidase-like [Stegodyphus dumicola]|uniref:peroxisomal N(1)-acetyl-spermine/spermidine oxidase-like n=1 Tax=Stegodyphus dumicola TaxID=202533 RepID=UPI0015B210E4|nr:peroxisomal N(1)-acetyl-spermine/spermidine oxidase-like [Stegodyphus dumicola]